MRSWASSTRPDGHGSAWRTDVAWAAEAAAARLSFRGSSGVRAGSRSRAWVACGGEVKDAWNASFQLRACRA